MPLFDYRCPDCGAGATLLAKAEDLPACPACGGTSLVKQLSRFAIGGGRSERPPSPAAPAATPGKHVCTGSCSHSYADALIKKHLG